ncbi:AAA domain-containing protein [Nevskia soli]|uniref:AAA domain-containing protein n=1 Tax=Nevskia soli TaxID=418856 RepID=UPI0004A748BD|nr:AAA domain-containing protein [Nevskia soli]
MANLATLRELLSSEALSKLQTDDVLFLLLPLMRRVAELHALGLVADLASGNILRGEDGALQLRASHGETPVHENDAIRRIQPPPATALNIVGETRVTRELGAGPDAHNALVLREPCEEPLRKPVYLPGLGAWELAVGHHDEITDIFVLGQLLACLACGLDFHDADDLEIFASHRRDLFRLNPRLSPVVASVIVEMTALNRHDRAKDLRELIRRLETWRDQPVELDVERVLARAQGAVSRRSALMSHLRDRLFDLSRRNRLLHFRPTQSSVNLTVASVPVVLQLETIKAEELCTWDSAFSAEVLSGGDVPLRKWLRFEDQTYLTTTLDHVLHETRRDRAEYGFSHLRLVVAFLRWHNLKEDPEERIQSPLLWLPVELHKKKGVRDQFVLSCPETEAEINPALRHYLRQLYDIELPEVIDLSQVSLESIHADLQAQIRRSEPGVELRLQRKPSIQLIHQKAVQRIEQFNRRRRPLRPTAAGAAGLPDFSYAADDFRPLGLAWFRRDVEHAPLPLRGAVGGAVPRHPSMAPVGVAQSTTYALHEDPGHRYAWDFDLTQVTLANLNYKKMSLVRDYNQLIEEQVQNHAFDRVFSIEPRPVETEPPPPLPLAEQWGVVAADRTQNAAVGLARTRRSFIIQGPPGTGKSQTITNLIADYVARNERVLFVCEKRAALDVVFHRLKQSGLDELCCLIHDSQTDKKSFVTNLRESYERWIGQPDRSGQLATGRAGTLEALGRSLAQIEDFENLMASIPAPLAVTVRELTRRLVELGSAGVELPAVEREALPDHGAFTRQRELVDRIHAFVRERFGMQGLAEHPFRFLSAALIGQPAPVRAVEAALDETEALLDSLDSVLGDGSRLLSADMPLSDAVALTQTLQTLIEARVANHPQLLDEHSGEAVAFTQEQARIGVLAGAAGTALSANPHWREKLSADDTEAALAFVKLREASLLRWFMPAWWRLRGRLRLAFDFSGYAVRPTFRKILEALSAEHSATAALTHAQQEVLQRYGVADVDSFAKAVEAIRQRVMALPILRKLRQKLAAAADPAVEAQRESTSGAAVIRLQALASTHFLFSDGTTLEQIGEHVRDLRERLEELPDMLPLLQALHQAEPACVSLLLRHALAPARLEALVAWESLARIQRARPELARFDEGSLTRLAANAAAGQKALLTQNAALIQARRHRLFLDHVRHSQLSTTQLDADGKLFKKQYANGRRELEHEFGKSMRFRSIRELAGGDPGVVVNDLKPVWLMSPLSVSDTLPLLPDLFDVVIFDEASQIPMEEAVPALCRAGQVVIVGDEMQLPPTSFFAVSGVEQEVVEVGDGEQGIGVTLDADSLLNQAARNLPATLLAWHYRSRYEALISFSNAAFYDGRLITIPDRSVEQAGGGELLLRSTAEDAARLGADAVMERAISFHILGDGVYVARSNVPEAEYIARLVRELLNRGSGLSLGVVAFSEAQQGEIEAALDRLGGEDSAFGAKLDAEYAREDEGQFNGLFVKNLENVQGDERDIILLSICYGPGPDGRMLMNFGPINQRGGEKRLNVIFSRARHRMAVVSTIRADAITNTHNDGAAALRSFLQFAQFSAQGQVQRAQATLASLNPGARQSFSQEAPREALRQTLARALRLRGYEVDECVGRSSFRCDLAIRDPLGDGYALGLLLDGGAGNDARERYVFRPGILRTFGWRVLEVLATDWLREPMQVVERIEAVLTGRVEAEVPAEEAPLPPELVEEAIVTAPLAVAVTPDFASREFRVQEGNSNKFWRIGVRDRDVVVTYGRVGSRGQTLTKSFDTPERAALEMRKLIAEKQRKGYLEQVST